MEKLVYVLWGAPGSELTEALAGPVAERLVALGSRGLWLNLVEGEAAAAAGSRLTRMEHPIAGMASFWLESADERGPFEKALSEVASRMAGYAVAESVPLLPPLTPGKRMAGIDVVALLERPERLAQHEWLHRWLDRHRAVALETQATFLYVRNVVVRALTPDAPAFAGIVEEGFATEAVGNPAGWYDAEGDAEKLKRNVGRMIESCKAFLDLDRVESHPTVLLPVQERPS